MTPEQARAILARLAQRKRAGPAARPKTKPKAKGPWKTVMAEHLEVADVAEEPELEPGGRVDHRTVTGRPTDRLLENPNPFGVYLREGRIVHPDGGHDSRLYTRDTARAERPDDRPEPTGEEQPPRPFVTPRAKRRRPRPWTGAHLDAAGYPEQRKRR